MRSIHAVVIFIILTIGYIETKGNAPSTYDWNDFKNFHMKIYANSADEEARKANFDNNVADVKAHNEAYRQGNVSYTKELNEFADIDQAEFRTRNGFKAPNARVIRKNVKSNSSILSLPASFDWTKKGKVSVVKNQGKCGSCWAFSATGALESQVLIHGVSKQLFSEQQLVSCDDKNWGCGGGFYGPAWDYIKKSKGIMSESGYPYTSSNGGKAATCKFNANKVVQTVSSRKDVAANDKAVMEALVTYGPLSVAIDASHWQLASDKIYSCKKPRTDHAVLLVGYGTKGGKDYWLVKNSWGTKWGTKGYFKVARGNKVDCGLNQFAAYPIL